VLVAERHHWRPRALKTGRVLAIPWGVSEGSTESRPARRGLYQWVVEHDDSWIFIVTYIGLAVILSVAIGLFWLVVVVAVHAVFEYVRQRHHDTRQPGVLLRAAWEVKLDVALVIFALALAVYMEKILGVVGLGGAARLGVQSGARVAGWARALRGILLSLDDAAQVARAAGARLKGKRGNQERQDEEAFELRPWRRWKTGDHVAIWLGVVFLVTLLAAPLVLPGMSYTDMLGFFTDELHPFPERD
jgi:hypothetical protein